MCEKSIQLLNFFHDLVTDDVNYENAKKNCQQIKDRVDFFVQISWLKKEWILVAMEVRQKQTDKKPTKFYHHQIDSQNANQHSSNNISSKNYWCIQSTQLIIPLYDLFVKFDKFFQFGTVVIRDCIFHFSLY